jgi:ferrous iron transport protein B
MKKKITVAFAGNPNVGKTALINALSGSKLKVGNWPGVTVEKKEADLFIDGYHIHLIDLPGVYSLSPYTLEEKITREYLLKKKPDLIVNVIDSTNIERNLYLTTQLMELEIPMVIVLNMWDEFQDKGYNLDIDKFSKILGIDAVPVVAVTGEGKNKLLEKIIDKIEDEETRIPTPIKFSEKLETEIQSLIKELTGRIEKYPLRWTAIKLLEEDEMLAKEMPENILKLAEKHIKNIEDFYGEDPESVIAEERYGYIKGLIEEVLKRPVEKKKEITDFLDSIVLNRIIGIPLFLFLLYIVFKFTFDGSAPFIDWVDGFVSGFVAKWIGVLLTSVNAPEWFSSLIIDGLIAGVGTVLTFVPLMIFLYFFLAILEESGYMARVAFLMDKIMRSVGLHGKSFIPLLIGFGCNVPAIYSTRTLENPVDRKITAAIQSFFSCGAKLPIYALFAAAFFTQNQALIVLSLYVLGVVVGLIWAVALRKTAFKGETPVFIMELPPYRFPTWKMILTSVSTRTMAFVKKAGTFITITMIFLWALMNIPYGAKPEDSVLGKVSQTISPIFYPQGFGQQWQAVASTIPGFAAKEVVVGALGMLYGIEEEEEEEKTTFFEDLKEQIIGFGMAVKDSFLSMVSSFVPGVFFVEMDEEDPILKAVKQSFTPLMAYSFMVFNLLLVSCVASMAAIYQEIGRKFLFFVIALTTGTAYVISALVYQLGRLFIGG